MIFFLLSSLFSFYNTYVIICRALINVRDTGRLLPFRCPVVQCCMFLVSFRNLSNVWLYMSYVLKLHKCFFGIEWHSRGEIIFLEGFDIQSAICFLVFG